MKEKFKIESSREKNLEKLEKEEKPKDKIELSLENSAAILQKISQQTELIQKETENLKKISPAEISENQRLEFEKNQKTAQSLMEKMRSFVWLAVVLAGVELGGCQGERPGRGGEPVKTPVVEQVRRLEKSIADSLENAGLKNIALESFSKKEMREFWLDQADSIITAQKSFLSSQSLNKLIEEKRNQPLKAETKEEGGWVIYSKENLEKEIAEKTPKVDFQKVTNILHQLGASWYDLAIADTTEINFKTIPQSSLEKSTAGEATLDKTRDYTIITYDDLENIYGSFKKIQNSYLKYIDQSEMWTHLLKNDPQNARKNLEGWVQVEELGLIPLEAQNKHINETIDRYHLLKPEEITDKDYESFAVSSFVHEFIHSLNYRRAKEEGFSLNLLEGGTELLSRIVTNQLGYKDRLSFLISSYDRNLQVPMAWTMMELLGEKEFTSYFVAGHLNKLEKKFSEKYYEITGEKIDVFEMLNIEEHPNGATQFFKMLETLKAKDKKFSEDFQKAKKEFLIQPWLGEK